MISREFVQQLCIAEKKRQGRIEARQQLHEQVQKVGELSMKNRPGKKRIEAGLGELRNKIELVIEKESDVVKHIYDEDRIIGSLKQRIEALERKLDAFIMLSNTYQNRARKLDEKIRDRMRPKHYELIKSRLRQMEDKHKKIRRKKGIDKEKVRVLKERIEELKGRLEKGL